MGQPIQSLRRKRANRYFLSSTLTLFCLQSALAAPAPEKTVWLLKQTAMVVGPYDVYVSDAGLRAVSLKSKLVIIFRPPNWKINAYNGDAKTSWSGDLKDFRPLDRSQRFFIMAGGWPNLAALDLPVKKEATELGLAGTEYSTTTSWSNQQQMLLKKGSLTDQNPRSVTYFLTTDVCQAWQPAAVLKRIFGVPDLKGMPLRFSVIKLSRSPSPYLNTISARKVTPPPGWLDVPSNYKLVRTMEEVNMDRGAQDGINQMLDSIRDPK